MIGVYVRRQGNGLLELGMLRNLNYLVIYRIVYSYQQHEVGLEVTKHSGGVDAIYKVIGLQKALSSVKLLV